MIPEKNAIEVVSTMKGEPIDMTIDNEFAGQIMEMMIKLYSDTELAIIREYSTNAWDSHVEAGQTRPIEITTPVALNPVLTIQDFGIGMDAEDIKRIYSRYGASTKRDSNAFNGTYGVGGKSALAYTQQFTLVGIKNGQKTTVIISRSESGGGTMTPQSAGTTNEPDGVTIMIPIKNHNQIDRKAREFFSYWEPGTVLINGEQPKRVEGIKITDNISIVDFGYVGYNRTKFDKRDIVVMGNVPYPASLGITVKSDKRIVARVPIGSVTIVPAREDLSDTAETRKTLELIKTEFQDNISDVLNKMISEAPTPYEAIRKATSLKGLVQNVSIDFEYKGAPIPKELKFDDKFILTENSDYKPGTHGKYSAIEATVLANKALFVYGYDKAKFTPTHKKKLRKYITEVNKQENIGSFVLTEKKVESEWIDPKRHIDWGKVQEVKLDYNRVYVPRDPNAPKRIPGSYDMMIDGVWHYERAANDIDQTNPIFYSDVIRSHSARIVSYFHPKATIVYLTANRVNKFLRLFPQATDKETLPEAKAIYKRLLGELTKEDKFFIWLKKGGGNRTWDKLYGVSLSAVKDPAIIVLIDQINRPRPIVDDLSQFDIVIGTGGAWRGIQGYVNNDAGKNWKSPLDRYPLLGYNGLLKQDGIDYVNALYAYRNKGQ